MDDPGLVGDVDGPGQRSDQLTGLSGWHRPLGQFVGETAPIDEFERKIGLPVVLANRVNRDDILMPQPGDGASLGPQPFKLLRSRSQPFRKRLDRHETIEFLVSRLVHNPHAAAANLPDDLESCDRRERFRNVRSWDCLLLFVRFRPDVMRGGAISLLWRFPDLM